MTESKWPKMIFHLIPAYRDRECLHKAGFPYRGKMPCTGPRVCPMCGTHLEDARPAEPEV